MAKFESIRDCRRTAYQSKTDHGCNEDHKSKDPLSLKIEDLMCMQLNNTQVSSSAVINTNVVQKRLDLELAIKGQSSS